jgi:hypothetical protein
MPTKVKGQIYTDQTGRFPVTSSRVSSQIFVFYDYDRNGIHAHPMPSKTAAEIMTSFKTIYNNLVLAGLLPQLQRLDNKCSTIHPTGVPCTTRYRLPLVTTWHPLSEFRQTINPHLQKSARILTFL